MGGARASIAITTRERRASGCNRRFSLAVVFAGWASLLSVLRRWSPDSPLRSRPTPDPPEPAGRDRDGVMDKTLVADLLDLADPKRLGGFGETFRFPFQTIEDVAILDDRTLIVANDNNFPFSAGRTPGKPDNNEFITVRLARPLHADPRATP